MKVLIVGAKGMLGQEIVQVFGNSKDFEITAWDRLDIDITNFSLAQEKINSLKPELIVNCAAYNNVDQAEVDSELAYLLNFEAVENLATISASTGATFIHFSTDYIFDGLKKEGYEENDEPKPAGVYAQSKLAGEKAVQRVGGKYYLIRLSRLFGKPAASENAKKSFVDIMLALSKSKSEIEVVDEEFSSPTYAPDLARATLDVIKFRSPYGIYHRTNDVACTWFEFAREIFKQKNIQVKLIPVSGDKFARKAKRPSYSRLISTKLPALRPWQSALQEYLSD